MNDKILKDDSDALSILVDLMPQLVWSAAPDGVVDYLSKRWYDYMETTPELVQAKDWEQLLHPDDVVPYQVRWQEALDTGQPYEIEYRFRRASDGVYRWFLGRAEPIKDADGKVTRWLGTCTDIDDQKQAELALLRISERERNISAMLQGAVQPALPENIPGLDLASYYKAALTEANVGGDFSDVFPVEKGCYCLVVGDLSGKGLSAAAQVATIRNMLRYAIYTNRAIAESITRLNRILIQNNLILGFATLVVVTFDLGAKTLTYVSCGQEPALIRRTHDGCIEELPPTGPILGMTESAIYTQQEVRLAPGDAFALYTDGLSEAGPNRRELLGVHGLAALMAAPAMTAEETLTQLIRGAEAHSGGEFHDDVCLLVGIVKANGFHN